MAGYLDQYGAGEERREKIIKTVVISLVALVVVGRHRCFSFFTITARNSRSSASSACCRRTTTRRPTRCGCAPRRPERLSVSMPSCRIGVRRAGTRDVSDFRIAKSRSCGSGVILTVDFGNESAGKALGAAGRPDDRILAAPRLPGAALTAADPGGYNRD